jgi:exopolyphosphatase/guanosine-5'-triphosphate,3'-diphosphate pyrophosphatase
MNQDLNYPGEPARHPKSPRVVAVIDIGATSVRMQIAEIKSDGTVRKLESFGQAVSLAKDSFIQGHISRDTIEDCVSVLEIYRAKLNEYGIDSPAQIRVIATSGVREASNRLAFVDRIFVATGLEIEPFEEAELHRVTYLGVLPFIRNQPEFFQDPSLVVEVGGGTSEVLLLEGEDVAFSHTYRLGALRLRNRLDRYDAPLAKSRQLLESQILQTVKQMKGGCPCDSPDVYVAMGGDVRFAAKEINQQPVGEQLVELDIHQLQEFTDEILNQSPDSLAVKFHMSLPDARTLGPALLTQLTIANEFRIKQFLVANVSLRDGLLKEMAEGSGWSDSIQEQVFRSALQIGRKFQFNEPHSVHTSELACTLFDQLQPLHQLPDRFRKILQIAALLHEIGNFVNLKSRHKHSMYLILNSEFFGIGSGDLELIALVARYHRGAVPQPTHDRYSALNRKKRVAVSKLAAIVRIAKALDITQNQRIRSIRCHQKGNRLDLITDDVADLSLERHELTQAAGMFEAIFGKSVSLTMVDETA